MEASDGHHRSAPDRLAIYQSGAQSQLCVLRPSVSSRVGSRTGSPVCNSCGNRGAFLLAHAPSSCQIHTATENEPGMLKLMPLRGGTSDWLFLAARLSSNPSVAQIPSAMPPD